MGSTSRFCEHWMCGSISIFAEANGNAGLPGVSPRVMSESLTPKNPLVDCDSMFERRLGLSVQLQ